MESYGALLKAKREEKGIELSTVARDTAITANFLEALEKEDAASLPSETYLKGFLRTYSDYLGCDTEKILQLYNAKVLQESPVPEGLIVRERPKYLIPLIATLCTLVFGTLAVFGALYAKEKIEENRLAKAEKNQNHSKSYVLNEKPFFGRLYKGDQLVVNTKDGSILVTVSNTVRTLSLESPAGIQQIELSEELELDVDGDSVPEFIIYVSDISTSGDNDRGAEAKILLKTASSGAREAGMSEIPSIAVLPQGQQTVILEDTRAYPFTLRADFRAGCVFRSKIDRNESVESYYANRETVNMTANNGIRLWISNGNSVKLNVIANSKSYDLPLGKAGEIVVQDVMWIKDTDGKYKLVINNVD